MTENVCRTVHAQADLLAYRESGVADGFQFNDTGICVVDVQRHGLAKGVKQFAALPHLPATK
ncbi:hypothetical protein ACULN0_05265 [Pectobacterium actinidiae]|uniref:hypothetical protein n=1 Tax=Pectobacterium actinidiae TaxID=1507808 RepID=UPI0040406EB9